MTETLFGTDEEIALEIVVNRWYKMAGYLRKNQISQRSSKTSRCHLFLVASLVLSDAALDCHQYSRVLELAKSLQFYTQCGTVKKVHIGFS